MTSVVITGPTVMSTESDIVPERAVILAEPAATPVTTPVLLTVAIAVLEDDHSNVAPNTIWPFRSSAIAENCTALPTAIFRGALMTTPAIVVTLGPLALPPHDRPAAANRQSRIARG